MQALRQKDDTFVIKATRDEALGLANFLGALTDGQARELHIPDAFYRLADVLEEPVSPDNGNDGSLSTGWNRVSVTTQLHERGHIGVQRVELQRYDGAGNLVRIEAI